MLMCNITIQSELSNLYVVTFPNEILNIPLHFLFVPRWIWVGFACVNRIGCDPSWISAGLWMLQSPPTSLLPRQRRCGPTRSTGSPICSKYSAAVAKYFQTDSKSKTETFPASTFRNPNGIFVLPLYIFVSLFMLSTVSILQQFIFQDLVS